MQNNIGIKREEEEEKEEEASRELELRHGIWFEIWSSMCLRLDSTLTIHRWEKPQG